MVSIKQWQRMAQLVISLTLALATIAVCTSAYRWLVMGALDYWLRLSTDASVILRRVGTIAMLFTGYWLFARFYERRTVTEWAFKPGAMIVSAISGALLISLTIIALFLLGNYQVSQYRGFDLAPAIVGTIFLGALVGELVFRGLVFRLFEQYVGTIWALAIPSVLFGLAHLFNDGASIMTLLSVTLLGAFWTLIYVWTRNLWVVTVNHAAWNTAIFLSGVPLSGQTEWRSASPWESQYQGANWLTGGAFGPEDSLINIVFMLVVVSVFAWRCAKRGSLTAQIRGG